MSNCAAAGQIQALSGWGSGWWRYPAQASQQSAAITDLRMLGKEDSGEGQPAIPSPSLGFKMSVLLGSF